MAVSNPATLVSICAEVGNGVSSFKAAIENVGSNTFFSSKNINSLKDWAGFSK